jgi:hypothetical protein
MILNEMFKDETALKTLYVSRPVLNKQAIRDYAKLNGFASTLPSDDFHVTVVYSKEKFDWDLDAPDQNIIYVDPSDKRELHVFDGGATVVHFKEQRLEDRWQSLIDMGASTSYPDYKAHITITYEGKPKDAIPYDGELILGPEKWTEINSDWKSEREEEPFD